MAVEGPKMDEARRTLPQTQYLAVLAQATDQLAHVVNIGKVLDTSTEARLRIPIIVCEKWRLVGGALQVLDSAELPPGRGDGFHTGWVEGENVALCREDPLRIIRMQGIRFVEQEVEILMKIRSG